MTHRKQIAEPADMARIIQGGKAIFTLVSARFTYKAAAPKDCFKDGNGSWTSSRTTAPSSIRWSFGTKGSAPAAVGSSPCPSPSTPALAPTAPP